jgi:choline dehydrogenase
LNRRYEITAAALVANTDPGKRYGTIVTVPVSPLSRGWVNITSNSTRDLPLVNPNQLSHPTDREVAVQSFKRARSFFQTQAMKPFAIKEVTPGSNVTSDEGLLDFIMANSYQNWHASCTCRMGRVDDDMAVVDSRARVIGVQGLRVVDASSFALLPPGHPQSTVCESRTSFFSPRSLPSRCVVHADDCIADVMAEKIAADVLGTT